MLTSGCTEHLYLVNLKENFGNVLAKNVSVRELYMDSREQEFWVLALDILRCRKIDNSQKNILCTSLSPLHPLTLPLGSGYLKHSPCVLKPMAAVWEQQVEA